MMSKEVAKEVLAALKSAGIDFVAFLPDTSLIELDRMADDDPDLMTLPVANEGDGIGACGGAWLGGKRPAIIMENAGLFLATYALMRSSISFGFPIMLIMSYRGEFKEARWFSVPNGWATEPLLKALRIPYVVVRRRADITAAIENVQTSLSSQQYPAAILFGGETIW